ncbi:hypothetical protein TNCV_1617351 [Trichonephila clavipes]|nr:hypothetical protein TNCV_1617351 [Trichonephila clavipes]
MNLWGGQDPPTSHSRLPNSREDSRLDEYLEGPDYTFTNIHAFFGIRIQTTRNSSQRHYTGWVKLHETKDRERKSKQCARKGIPSPSPVVHRVHFDPEGGQVKSPCPYSAFKVIRKTPLINS